MDLDFKAVDGYDLKALESDLLNRQETVKSLEWAVQEHKTEINKLEVMIAWKKQNDNKNRHNS